MQIIKLILVVVLGFSLTAFAKQEEQRIQAVYEIPLNNAELAPWAHFSFGARIRRQDDGSTKISYRLPIELTGVTQSIEVSNSAQNPTVFVGDKAEATCLHDGTETACMLRYHNLAGSFEQASSWLRQHPFSPLELQGRLDVAKLFSCEPIGVLQMDTKLLNFDSPLMRKLRDEANKLRAACVLL